MPRPTSARELIQLDAGALDFRVGDWWDQFREGRVFFLRDYPGLMARVGIASIRDLAPFVEQAIDEIRTQTEWPRQLEVRHWSQCDPSHLTAAARSEPQLFSKAVICLVTMELYLRANNRPEDVFQEVQLVGGAYTLEGWTAQTFESHSGAPEFAAFVADAKTNLGQRYPDRVMRDVGAGQHATYPIIALAHQHLGAVAGLNLTISTARRQARSGMKPASKSIVA